MNEPINQAFIGYAPANLFNTVVEEGTVTPPAPPTYEELEAQVKSLQDIVQGLQVEKLKLELVLCKVADLINDEGKEVLKVT